MKGWLEENPNTAMMYVVFVIVALVGGILVIFDKAGSLSFEDYIKDLTTFAVAVGIFGAGRAVKNGLLKKDSVSDNQPLAVVDVDAEDVHMHDLPSDSDELANGPDDGVPVDSAIHPDVPR